MSGAVQPVSPPDEGLARLAGLREAVFQGDYQILGGIDADKTADDDSITIADLRHRFLGGDDFAFVGGRPGRKKGMQGESVWVTNPEADGF